MRSIRILVCFSTVAYSFAAAWYLSHYGVVLPGETASNRFIQIFDGFIEAVVLGVCALETILTPAIVALALLRTPGLWITVTLTAALLTWGIGYQLGTTGPQYFTPFWNFLIGLSFNAPLLAIWGCALTLLIKSIQRAASKGT